jgi:RNA polymerase sigma factor (sigma-70 family)
VNRERSRLRSFIRRRVADPRDAEDILQDVFSTLVEANRLLMPIDHITGWLYRVARNRIIDLFRSRTMEPLELEDLLRRTRRAPTRNTPARH